MIHLDAKTSYSFMRGYGLAEDWVSRATAIGAPSLAVADYCSTWGHVPFRTAVRDTELKILYGVTLPVVRSLEKDPRHALVVLLARQSVQPLYDLVTLAHEQAYYRPRIMWNQIPEDLEVILVAGGASDLAAFEKMGRGYLGVPPTKNMLSFAAADFDCVPAASPVYPFPEQRQGYELVQAISDLQRIGEAVAGSHHLLRQGELDALYEAAGIQRSDVWYENSRLISERCTAQIPVATDIKVEGDLVALAQRGLGSRGLGGNQEYCNRLEEELQLVKDKGFEDYFLFVEDVVGWAKERMFVGPGRGSVGGSLLAFLLGISSVDPIVHGTRFDRFIDAGRPDLPDIDIDFPDSRRDEIFSYLKEKYGDEKVARIGTMSLFGGKSAINDTARATGIQYGVARDIGRNIEAYDSLAEFFESDEGADWAKRYPDIRKSILLDGIPRHHGKHAAGVCVTNEAISNYGAVDKEGVIALDLKNSEKVGLLKLDALGLTTLSVIDECCQLIGKDPYTLQLDNDPDVWEVFNSNHMTGIFQFEGPAVRRLTREMKVDCFDDLCALTSLARPGPLLGGAADEWVSRRMGAEWEYKHVLMEPITSETYGTLIYQEQVMAAVRDIAGFDAVEVNQFRRAVGKKDPEALAAFRDKWMEDNPMDEQIAAEVWEEMCEFGGYAFNKSHAVAYSMISYYAAWLKAKFPLEFSLAQLNSNRDEEHSKAILREIVQMGYEFVAFDPHLSEDRWAIKDGVLVGGFLGVKGVGAATARSMLEARAKDPDGWLGKLTPAQRNKILTEHNTPWHELSRLHEKYQGLYDNNADDYQRYGLNYSRGRVVEDIANIEEGKGTHTFLGKLIKRQERDLNSEHYLKKRGGQKFNDKTTFMNVFFEDDTGDIGCTINRYKYDQFAWLNDADMEGRDFIVKGNIINDNGVWIFIEQVKEIKDATGTS